MRGALPIWGRYHRQDAPRGTGPGDRRITSAGSRRGRGRRWTGMETGGVLPVPSIVPLRFFRWKVSGWQVGKLQVGRLHVGTLARLGAGVVGA